MADQSIKGTNWGRVIIDDKNLSLSHLSQNVIKFPLKRITNSNIQKNDIVLQLSTEECAENEDMLCEVRFYIPPKEQKTEKKKQESNEEEQDEISYLQQVQNQIVKKAKIGGSSDSILTIHEVPLIVPRGKYTMDFFKKDIRFHGNTYQFNTDYKSITRFFLLPMPDEVNLSLVIGLENPIKQGQTAYNYIVMQFRKDLETQIEMKYTREQLDNIGWKGIRLEYSGSMFDVVCDVLSEITGIKVVSPKNFKCKNGLFCLRCSVVPHSGFLFPLEKSLLYIQKPVIYIKHDDIKEIVFQRITQTTQNKFFDIKIVTQNTSHLFSTVDREELDNLSQYFNSKKLQVKKIQEENEGIKNGKDDSEDGSQNGNDHKITLSQMDSDEDDEDFQAQEDSYNSVQFQQKVQKTRNVKK
ncbi:unnamed protein product [Paramecium pentaurelia]|uniref:Histone chaperone RTT106/FACT complex subunit SPT16-like middle domain-containing protein n=1 Tax=Paramecium pentaurelia TaxID=43138 RepID=A0A8S1WBS0_9CILI|nr:unnamed protein product [Paramecium pentaurelia]